MITFKTVTGSIYEVDGYNNRCRRLTGSRPRTDRQSEDGTWQEYESVSDIQLDKQVMFTWRRRGPDDSMVQPATITSPVKEILTEKS